MVLYEKFDEQREIPVSDPLLQALRAQADERSGVCDRVFHYAPGQCLTNRRFDTIFRRAGRHLPWADSLGVSLHWLRYSTLTDIRMVAGERVAAAYAGHGDQAGGITATYSSRVRLIGCSRSLPNFSRSQIVCLDESRSRTRRLIAPIRRASDSR